MAVQIGTNLLLVYQEDEFEANKYVHKDTFNIARNPIVQLEIDNQILLYKDKKDIKMINLHDFAENNNRVVLTLEKDHIDFIYQTKIDRNTGNLIYYHWTELDENDNNFMSIAYFDADSL